MPKFLYFILGAMVGYWICNTTLLHGKASDAVYLKGGAITSSTVGVVYGWEDDEQACAIYAAGMNYYHKVDDATKETIMETDGSSFCSVDPN